MDHQLTNHPQPQFFQLSQTSHQKDFNQLAHTAHPHIVDTYHKQLIELYKIRHPRHKTNTTKLQLFINQFLGHTPENKSGTWIYYPWKNTLVHLLDQSEFFELRTARNFPLISKKDQLLFNQLSVGIIGLSVGNSIALSLVYAGGANTIKLADPDTLELSNLNRIHATVLDLGENKTYLAAKQIYEINPYAKLILYPEGLTPENIKSYLTDDPKPNLIIDECDNLTIKFNLRLIARSLKLPLLMVSDNGFESNIDLLRFDTHPNAGRMGDAPILSTEDLVAALNVTESLHLTPAEETQLIIRLVGADKISHGMQQASFKYVKRQIAGWPQLSMTVFAGGALATYTALLLAKKSPTKGRTTSFSFPELLDPKHHTPRRQLKHLHHTKKFKHFIKSLS